MYLPTYTVKPVNKGHLRERHTMIYIDKCLHLEVILYYFIKEWLLKCGLNLQGGLYSEVAFNTGLTYLLTMHFIRILTY